MTNVSRQATGIRVRPAVGLRMVGVGCLWLAGAVLLEALSRGVGALDGWPIQAARWFCLVVFVLITVLGLVAAFVPVPAVVLDSAGIRNRLARPGQVRKASWSDVSSVRQGSRGAIVVELSGNRTSVIPSVLLNAKRFDIEAEISARLNDAHGYRPVT